MRILFGSNGWGWRLWGISNGDKWFLGLSITKNKDVKLSPEVLRPHQHD